LVFWNADLRGFVLGDMKTIKGDGVAWIEKDGAKKEHIAQLSRYWHALVAMGLPMVKGFGVLYWPKDRGLVVGRTRERNLTPGMQLSVLTVAGA
jgi:hypothetical protein